MVRVALTALFAIAAATCSAIAAELRVAVEGLRAGGGIVLIGLYDTSEAFERAIALSDKEGFLNDPQRVAGIALRTGSEPKQSIRIENLDPGRYAVIAFHDANANGRLDKNFWGVPKEPYGFSNDAQGFLGPPRFEDAAIDVGEGSANTTIALVYHVPGEAGRPSPYGEEGAPTEKPLNPVAAGDR